MSELFKFTAPDGNKYDKSSAIPTIMHDGKEISRQGYWQKLIAEKVSTLPAPVQGEQPVYVATAGGYGSFDGLIEHEKQLGHIPAGVPSIKGDDFRSNAAFAAEIAEFRRQAAEHLKAHGEEPSEKAIDQIQSAFYSDEVNTKIAKEVVIAVSKAGKSSAYESASIYPDTQQRAELAKQHGVKSVLVVGARDFAKVLHKEKDGTVKILDDKISHIAAFNTARSFQQISERFDGKQGEPEYAGQKPWKELFDEIRIYDTDQKPPVLIAEKKQGQELKIIDQAKFDVFIANKNIPLKEFENSHDIVGHEHRMNIAKQEVGGLIKQASRDLQSFSQPERSWHEYFMTLGGWFPGKTSNDGRGGR